MSCRRLRAFSKTPDRNCRSSDRQKVLLAFIYPALVTVVASAVVIGLVVYVVPQVTRVFENTGQKLPLIRSAESPARVHLSGAGDSGCQRGGHRPGGLCRAAGYARFRKHRTETAAHPIGRKSCSRSSIRRW